MTIYLAMITSIVLGMCLIKSQTHIGIKSRNKLALIWAGSNLWLIAGFRKYYIGNDTTAYVDFYKSIDFNNIENSFNSYFENGYVFYNICLKFIFENSQMLLIITSLIIIIGISKFLYDYSDDIIISIYLFIVLINFIDSMVIMRQYVALIIVLYSIRYIREKKIFKYILGIIIASSFHNSALISIVFYYIYNNKLKFKQIVSISILSTVMFIFFDKIIMFIVHFLPKYQAYVERLDSFKLASVVAFIINCLIFVFGFIVIKKFKYEEKDQIKNNFVEYIVFLNLCLSLLGIKFNIISRVSVYFSIFNILYITNNLAQLKDVKDKVIFKIIIGVIGMIYFLTLLILRPDWYGVYPYKFFWER